MFATVCIALAHYLLHVIDPVCLAKSAWIGAFQRAQVLHLPIAVEEGVNHGGGLRGPGAAYYLSCIVNRTSISAAAPFERTQVLHLSFTVKKHVGRVNARERYSGFTRHLAVIVDGVSQTVASSQRA